MSNPSLDFAGRSFQFWRASDLERDGMGFEAWEGDNQVAELSYWDSTGKATLSTFKDDLPVVMIRYMVTEGLENITPVR